MDGFDAALARYRAFLAHDPITPLLRRSLALLVPGNIRVDTVIVTVVGNVVMDAWHGNNVTTSYNK